MKCPNCTNYIIVFSNSEFCYVCGAKLDKELRTKRLQEAINNLEEEQKEKGKLLEHYKKELKEIENAN